MSKPSTLDLKGKSPQNFEGNENKRQIRKAQQERLNQIGKREYDKA